MNNRIKLTEYSHGAGCGCKISPQVLDVILHGNASAADARLLVGNSSRDDAAVYDLGNGQAIISTTDFFMPIVDDPYDFGRIAATNALSDVYAMGGTPMLAIGVLGWPINQLSAMIARKVVQGGRDACDRAGISLAGGHSIDASEPFFGLAVTGSVAIRYLKRNDTGKTGNRLYLTKPLGIGIHATAQKQKKLRSEHLHIAVDAMCELNTIGAALAKLDVVTAMTDVTGFGLLGHLIEMCEGSGLHARIDFDRIVQLEATEDYRQQGCIPGATERNFESYGTKVAAMTETERQILCDPQTSGGLLVAAAQEAEKQVFAVARRDGCSIARIGELIDPDGGAVVEIVSGGAGV